MCKGTSRVLPSWFLLLARVLTRAYLCVRVCLCVQPEVVHFYILTTALCKCPLALLLSPPPLTATHASVLAGTRASAFPLTRSLSPLTPTALFTALFMHPPARLALPPPPPATRSPPAPALPRPAKAPPPTPPFTPPKEAADALHGKSSLSRHGSDNTHIVATQFVGLIHTQFGRTH